MSPNQPIELHPLGGLGEFGMNFMVLRQGDDFLVIDCGIKFAGPEMLGVDIIIPDFEPLETLGTFHGLLLTHGHEDHIGAVPWLLEEYDIATFATPYTAGLLRPRLKNARSGRKDPIVELNPQGGKFRVGPFSIETIPVAHSMPQCLMFAIETDQGLVVHSGDFKLEPAPLDGVETDLPRLRELGNQGVYALLADSTNAELPGFTPSETRVAPALDRCFAEAPGKIFLTTFSSNIYRIQQVANATLRAGRRLVILGSSLERHVELASRLGILHLPAGLRVTAEKLANRDPRSLVILATGSQGEPNAAISRIAAGTHRETAVEAGDRLIHSARSIPGNERAIYRIFNRFIRRGATVMNERNDFLHVSGHASREEQRLLLQALQPKHFIPVHGEFSMLQAHLALAKECGMEKKQRHLLASGESLILSGETAERGEPRILERHYLDGNHNEIDREAQRERGRVAADGLIVITLPLVKGRPDPSRKIDIRTRGLADREDSVSLLDDLRVEIRRALVTLLKSGHPALEQMEDLLQHTTRRFFRRRTRRIPLIVPVVVES